MWIIKGIANFSVDLLTFLFLLTLSPFVIVKRNFFFSKTEFILQIAQKQFSVAVCWMIHFVCVENCPRFFLSLLIYIWYFDFGFWFLFSWKSVTNLSNQQSGKVLSFVIWTCIYAWINKLSWILVKKFYLKISQSLRNKSSGWYSIQNL